MRTKQDYVLNQKDSKYIPEKVGLKAVQRDGLDYEFTLVFDVNIKHFAVSSKDRTGLFMGKSEFVINTYTGKRILDWYNEESSLVQGSNITHVQESGRPEEININVIKGKIQLVISIFELLVFI